MDPSQVGDRTCVPTIWVAIVVVFAVASHPPPSPAIDDEEEEEEEEEEDADADANDKLLVPIPHGRDFLTHGLPRNNMFNVCTLVPRPNF